MQMQTHHTIGNPRSARVPSALRRRTVYLAAPLVAFDSSAYDRTQDALVRAGCFVIAARDEFSSTADWLARFGDVLSKVQALVVVPGPGGVVGAGVLREIVEAIVLGIPTYLADGNRFHPLYGVRFTVLDRPSRHCFARVEFPLRKRR
jgi:hypothetical protein